MKVLPVITRELRAQARQPFTYWLRALGVVALLGGAVLFINERLFEANLGGALFGLMHFMGYCAIWLLVPLGGADCISRERRETYATTGPRMQLRFFGGFGLGEGDLEGDWVTTGYEKGVPMGGEISGAPDGQAVTFWIAASKDPEGANLDRVQIIKGWVDAEGEGHERIFEVKWSGDRSPGADGKLPPVGDTVDRETAEYTNSIGAAELIGAFTDPDFDPAQKAFYYVRVLEIPTPRWTLHDKLRFGIEMDDEVPLVHQERAFSSPIWYAP
jgi:hypothetical protein